MRMTIKGQVTIPAPVRRELGLRPGDDVQFLREGGRFVVTKQNPDDAESRARRMEDWLGRFTGSAGACPWSTDDILDMTRGSDRREPARRNP